MATAAFLSQHSSNPLEVPSSDARNRTYLRRYREAKAAGDRDSDDLAPGFDEPEVEEYQEHLADLFPRYGRPKSKGPQPHPQDLVDLDEDMDSDEGDEGSASESGDDDVDVDAEGEIDEELSIYLKNRDEREEIEAEISDLEDAVPELTADYRVVDLLGTGTFSSVYKAVDLGYHAKWDNSVWHGHHPPESSAYYQSAVRPRESKVFVAIKRIYVTSSPERVRNEIMIMETCRGSRHVSQIITAFRKEDQVVTVMPYHRNEDFRV